MSSARMVFGSRLVISSIGVSLDFVRPAGPLGRSGDYKRLSHSPRSGERELRRGLINTQRGPMKALSARRLLTHSPPGGISWMNGTLKDHAGASAENRHLCLRAARGPDS